MKPESYISVTELCENHSNLMEYVSGLEKKLLHAKCDIKDMQRDVAKTLSMAVNLNLDLQNKADLWRDEFQRIRAIVYDSDIHTNSEIAGICDRAMSDIRSKISLIDQREKVADENARLRRKLVHYDSLRAELVDREARSLYGAFHAAACSKDMEYCRTLASARLRIKCTGCNGRGEISGQFPDGSYQTDVCHYCEGSGCVEIPELPSCTESGTHNVKNQAP